MISGKRTVKKQDVIDALEHSGGCQAIAARALNVSRTTMFRYLQRWPVLKELIEEKTEQRLDEAEVSLRAAVLKGEAWAVCFFLKTKGKNRGYTERMELEGQMKHQHEPVKIEIEVVKDVRKDPAPPNAG